MRQSLIQGACLGCQRRARSSCGLALEQLSEGKTRGSQKGKEVVTESYKALQVIVMNTSTQWELLRKGWRDLSSILIRGVSSQFPCIFLICALYNKYTSMSAAHHQSFTRQHSFVLRSLEDRLSTIDCPASLMSPERNMSILFGNHL